MIPTRLLQCLIVFSLCALPVGNSVAAPFPDGWPSMEIEAKWETSEAVFDAIIDAFPDGGSKYGFTLDVRWPNSGRLRKYVDIYFDDPGQNLFNSLHMLRHRQRLRTQANVSIADSVVQLQNANWSLDWEKVQYKSTPTRLGSAWFRTEHGAAQLTPVQVSDTLAGNAPQPPYSPSDNPVDLLLGDHPGFNFGNLNAALEVHQYRYRIEFKVPGTNQALFELSMDKVVTDPNGSAQISYGVELEVLRNGVHQEALVQELFTIAGQLEQEFCLQSANASKGGIWVEDAALAVSARGTVEGVVRLEDGSVVQDAPVTFIRHDGGVRQCVASGNNGAYQIILPEGNYGYRIARQDKEDAVGAITLGANAVLAQDMTLRDPRLTTVLLVRHAEKGADHPTDPELTEAGWRRAKHLAHVARKAGVSAVYSSDYKRTRHTLEPLAKFYLKLEPVLYDANNAQGLVDTIRADHAGDVVMVAGHSNTLLTIANAFGSNFAVTPHVNDFDNFFVIAERVDGANALNVINLQYGTSSAANPPTADSASATEMTNLILVRQDVEPSGAAQRPQALAHLMQKSGVSAVYTDQNQNQDLVQPLINALPNINAAIPYDPTDVTALRDNVLQNHAAEIVLVAGSHVTLQAITEAVNSNALPLWDAAEHDNLLMVTVHRTAAPIESRLLSLQYGLPSPKKNVSVVQVLDRTGSMSHQDHPSAPSYMASARVAAQNFIGLMAIGDQAGVVAFDDEGCDNAGSKAEPIFNLTELSDEFIRGNAIASINGIDDRGCTSIGAGIEFAQGPNFLADAAPNQPRAMVLLTDGYENRTPWVRERPPNYSHLPAVPNNVLTAVPNDIDIFTVALGPNADQSLMRDIADTTGGQFYESPSILGLLSIYYQIHGELTASEMVDLDTGLKQAGNDTRIAIIDAFAGEATFMLGWLQSRAAMVLRITDPNGKDLDLADPAIEVGSDSNHYYVKIQRPVAGNWTVRILRRDKQRFSVDYTYAAFVKGTEKMWSFTPQITLAGACLIPRVRLYETHSGRPIAGASVRAIVTQPVTSKHTLNYQYVAKNGFQWQTPNKKVFAKTKVGVDEPKTSPDPLTPLAQNLVTYNRETMKRTGASIFQYKTTSFVLHDDGKHNDANANDGLYAVCIDSARIAGGHNMRFEISGVTSSGRPFSRKKVATATILPGAVDIGKTLVRTNALDSDDDRKGKTAVLIVPMDRFGNVWGPGHAARIAVTTTAGVLSGPVRDNGDGFYVQEIRATKPLQRGAVVVTIDGRKMTTQPKTTLNRPSGRLGGCFIGTSYEAINPW